MTTEYALLYGLIQGFSEFLPISSSGHLAVLPLFLKFEDPGVLFDLAMHLGTALAVIIYFRKTILEIIKAMPLMPSRVQCTLEQRIYSRNYLVAVASTITLVAILYFPSKMYGRHDLFIAFNLAFFGVLMFLADRFLPQKKDLMVSADSLSLALWVGLAQALAIFPGVSRSGVTLTMARLFKMDRAQAGAFSFLLSLPIIFMGVAFKLLKTDFSSVMFSFYQSLLGILVSFLVGLVTIHYFLKFLSKFGLWPYTLYRILLAFLIFKINRNL